MPNRTLTIKTGHTLQLESGAWLKTAANVGTAETGVTAVEYGDGYHHLTELTVSTTLPAIAGGADLAVGKLLYTFPAGVIAVNVSHMSLAIQQTEGNITADTPDGGLGTVIASGAVAVLSGTATFENILTGQTFDDCDALRFRDATERELRRLGGRGPHRRTRAGQRDASGIESLTERELQVAQLIVDRRTNPQIAAELFLSPKTVESHVRNLFHKLGVSSRVEVARVIERAGVGRA